MKFFIAVSVLLAVVGAKPSGIPGPALYAIPAAIASPISGQYHSQDVLGQYSYGYANSLSAKAESRSLDGTTVGGYTYVDPDGKIQSVEYSSDGVNGFRVAASNLPVAPAVPEVPVLPQPVPVQDTPEVVEAKARHFAALEEAKVRSAQILAPAALEVKSLPTEAVALAPASPVAAAVPTAPAVSVKSAVASAEEVKSVAAPVAEVKTFAAPAVAVRSFVSPTIAVRAAPVISAPGAFGYSYGLNTLYGYNAYVAEPAITAYAFGSHVFAAPVPGAVLQSAEVAREDKGRSE